MKKEVKELIKRLRESIKILNMLDNRNDVEHESNEVLT